jgi:hypothetical protein
MAVHIFRFLHIASLLAASLFAVQVSAAGVSFAGSTGSAAAAVAMNGGSTHVADSHRVNAVLVSAQGKYPPIDYKPQVFQRLWSEIRVPGARDPRRNQAILNNNAKVFATLAGMYKQTTAYAMQQNRKLMIDVLTVEAVGGAKGFARSRKFAQYIFQSLKDNGVENIALDPEPRDPIPLPPELTDQPPRGRT